MSETSKPSIIEFEPALHQALQAKAASSNRSISEIVNDALREALREDQEDLTAFDERAAEPTMSAAEIWEQNLLSVAKACGSSPPHSALSSEGLYD